MRSPRVKVATLDSEDRERLVFPYWTEYSVGQDIRKYSSSARLTISPCTTTDARAVLREIDRAGKIATFIEGVRVLTGYVSDIESGQDGKSKAPSAVVTIDDVLGQTQECALPDGFNLIGLTVKQVAEKVYGPFGLTVVVGNVGNRLALSRRRTEGPQDTTSANNPELARLIAESRLEGGSNIPVQEYLAAHPQTNVVGFSETKESRALHPQPGETIDRFMIRFCRENGLLVWASGAGDVILSAPDWTQEPTYRLTRSRSDHTMSEGRIRGGRLVRQPGRVAHEVIVLGRGGKRGAESRKGIARDEEAIAALVAQGRHWRTRKEHDASLRDQQAAQRRADLLLAQAKMAAKTYTCSVANHGVGIALQAIDQMVGVYDECAIDDEGETLDANLWCVGRDFSAKKKTLTTNLSFAWPGSWTSDT